jgi:hypothetical protein
VPTQERMGLILSRGCMGLAWLDLGPAHTAKDRRGVGCPAVLVKGAGASTYLERGLASLQKLQLHTSLMAEYVDSLSER